MTLHRQCCFSIEQLNWGKWPFWLQGCKKRVSYSLEQCHGIHALPLVTSFFLHDQLNFLEVQWTYVLKENLGKVEIDYIGIDTVEMYVLIFQRSLILFKANEVTFKASCRFIMFIFIYKDWILYIAQCLCHWWCRRKQNPMELKVILTSLMVNFLSTV